MKEELKAFIEKLKNENTTINERLNSGELVQDIYSIKVYLYNKNLEVIKELETILVKYI